MTNYQAPPPPPYAYVPEHPRGTLVLVLGILSIPLSFCYGIFGLALGIPAWVLGASALKQIRTQGVPVSNRGTLQAGMICGIVGTVIGALIIIGFVVFVILAATHPDGFTYTNRY